MKLLKNNSGFSLVEALIGVAIIAIAATTITQFGTIRQTSKKSQMSTSCKSIAKSVIDHVKDVSVSSGFSSYFIGDNVNDFSNASITNFSGRLNNAADSWVGASSADSPFLDPAPFEVNTSLLMESSIRLLTSIYNSRGGNTDFAPYAPITGQTFLGSITKNSSLGIPPTITIKVVPYDLDSKNEAAPAQPLYIRPQGGGGGAGPAITHWTNSVDNLGMRLAVEVTYTPQGGGPETCQSSHDFQYPIDNSRPSIEFLEVTENTYTGGVTPNSSMCASPADEPTNVTVRLGVSAANFEEGLVFLCRDSSTATNHSPPVGSAPYDETNFAGETYYPCNNAAISSSAPVRYGIGPDNSTPNTLSPPSNPGAGLGGGWVPCHSVSLCGENINSFNINDQTANTSLDRNGDPTNRVVLTMEFNLPTTLHCQYGMEAIAVDAAGNKSDQEDLSIAGANSFSNSAVDNGTHITSETQVVGPDGNSTGATNSGLISSQYFNPAGTPGKAPPHCTSHGLCTDPGPGPNEWHSNWRNDFPDGYYTCRGSGCCVDNSSGTPPSGTTSDLCHPYR